MYEAKKKILQAFVDGSTMFGHGNHFGMDTGIDSTVSVLQERIQRKNMRRYMMI